MDNTTDRNQAVVLKHNFVRVFMHSKIRGADFIYKPKKNNTVSITPLSFEVLPKTF